MRSRPTPMEPSKGRSKLQRAEPTLGPPGVASIHMPVKKNDFRRRHALELSP